MKQTPDDNAGKSRPQPRPAFERASASRSGIRPLRALLCLLLVAVVAAACTSQDAGRRRAHPAGRPASALATSACGQIALGSTPGVAFIDDGVLVTADLHGRVTRHMAVSRGASFACATADGRYLAMQAGPSFRYEDIEHRMGALQVVDLHDGSEEKLPWGTPIALVGDAEHPAFLVRRTRSQTQLYEGNDEPYQVVTNSYGVVDDGFVRVPARRVPAPLRALAPHNSEGMAETFGVFAHPDAATSDLLRRLQARPARELTPALEGLWAVRCWVGDTAIIGPALGVWLAEPVEIPILAVDAATRATQLGAVSLGGGSEGDMQTTFVVPIALPRAAAGA